MAAIEPILRQQAATYEQALTMVREQLLPIGLLESVVGKPYAALFTYRPLGFHRAASFIQRDIDIEFGFAQSVVDGECIIDASALYTLALIPDAAAVLTDLPRRLCTTAASLGDLSDADDYFSLPAVGTIGFDPEHQRVFATQNEEDIRRLQQKQIRTMLETARSLRRVNHPALLHLGSPDESVWLLNVDAAKEKGAFLWCDDLGLRRLAHGLGVKTFGTMSLLEVARRRGRLDGTSLTETTRTLAIEHVVDLPFDQDLLTSIAAEQEWRPQSVATVLRRPATWVQAEPAANVLRQVLRNAPSDKLGAWTYAAFHGLKSASAEGQVQNNLAGLATAIFCENWSQPGHVQSVSTSLTTLAPEVSGAVVKAAMSGLWQHLTQKHRNEDATRIFLYLVSDLDDAAREHAVALVLHTPQETRRRHMAPCPPVRPRPAA